MGKNEKVAMPQKRYGYFDYKSNSSYQLEFKPIIIFKQAIFKGHTTWINTKKSPPIYSGNMG